MKKLFTILFLFSGMLSLGSSNEELRRLFNSDSMEENAIECMQKLIETESVHPNSVVAFGHLSLHGSNIEEKLNFLIDKGLDLSQVSSLTSYPDSDRIKDILIRGKLSQVALLSSIFESNSPSSLDQMKALIIKDEELDPNSLIRHGQIQMCGHDIEEKFAFLVERGLDPQQINFFNSLPLDSIEMLQSHGVSDATLMKSLFHCQGSGSLEEMKRLFKMSTTSLDLNYLTTDGFLSLHGNNIEAKLNFLIEQGLDLHRVRSFANIQELSVDLIRKLIADNIITINQLIVPYGITEAIINIINEASGETLIDPITLNTMLHYALSKHDNVQAMMLLEKYPNLMNFANQEHEVPVMVSYKAKNIEGVKLCAYFGVDKPFVAAPDEMVSALKTLPQEALFDFKSHQPILEFHNQKNVEHKTLFVFIQGIDTSTNVDMSTFSSPIIENHYPVITIGNGVLPANLFSIDQALQAVDTNHFETVKIILLMHGHDAKQHFRKYEHDEQTHHRISLNHLFTEKTEDLFMVLKKKFSGQKISILQYACYGGLSMIDAQKIFGKEDDFEMITLSSQTLPTRVENKVVFASDKSTFQREIENFPYSVFQKYLMNMSAINNLPVMYKNGDIYDAAKIISNITDHGELLDYIAEHDKTLLPKGLDKKIDLNHYALALVPLVSTIDYGMITLDEPSQDDGTAWQTTKYYQCMSTSYGNEQYCKEKFGKPVFGVLQKHLFDYWDEMRVAA